MADHDAVGGYVVATGETTLGWAVDEMVRALGMDQLDRLNVSAGEHLAAILTSAFLGCPPVEVDTSGGVDLLFDLSGQRAASVGTLLPEGRFAAFEVKSMPGPFREFDARIDRDHGRGIDATGRRMSVRARAANDILVEALPWLERAAVQLARKAGSASRNIFLVIHPFDYLASECVEHVIIGQLLDPLDVDDVDTVWVLWVPDHITVWSSHRREWIDLLIASPEDGATESGQDQLGILQATEQRFFGRIGHTTGSPYMFSLTSG